VVSVLFLAGRFLGSMWFCALFLAGRFLL
jgi:hypothetical protein